jgi:hypothetical protein
LGRTDGGEVAGDGGLADATFLVKNYVMHGHTV